MKKTGLLLALILMIVAVAGVFADDDCNGPCDGGERNSSTLDINECVVRINDRVVKDDVAVLKAFDRGDELEVRVEFVSSQDAEDVQIIAFLTGYHRGHKFRDMVFDITPTFDVNDDVSYEKVLSLKLPDDFELDSGDELKLRVEISDKFSKSYVKEYNLKVEALRNNVVIQDVLLDPADEVEAGRGVFASVRVKNMGEDTEESIKVTTSIPELRIKATEYIDELDADEATTSEDMFLRIPVCAEAGDYVVKVEVAYADGDEVIEEQTTLTVTDGECEALGPSAGGSETGEKTVVTIPGKQDVIIGTSGTVYPIMLENRGAADKAYLLSSAGLESWATYRFDPGTYVLVKAGQSQTAYLYVTPKDDAPVGEKIFMVSVEAGGDKKQVALTANVIAGKEESPVSGLELGQLGGPLTVGIIVLVVLIIVLLLVIGFNKLKGNDDEPEEVAGQTYY